MKPAIGMPSIKNIQNVDKLTNNRVRYAQESRKSRKSSIDRDN